MLVYVYPLRLMFSALFSWISGRWLPSEFVITDIDELLGLFIIYGIGFAAMSLIMVFLYSHSKSIKKELILDELEVLRVQSEIKICFTLAITGLASAIYAFFFPPRIAV